MAKSCIHNYGDNRLGMITNKGHHGFVQLLQTRLRTALSGDV